MERMKSKKPNKTRKANLIEALKMQGMPEAEPTEVDLSEDEHSALLGKQTQPKPMKKLRLKRKKPATSDDFTKSNGSSAVITGGY